MYALGKVSDIEKVVWFTAGTAITAAATVVQSYLSNKRAVDERIFTERMETLKRKSDQKRLNKENAIKLRMDSYEYFTKCLSSVFERAKDMNEVNKLFHATARLRLVAPANIALKAKEAWHLALTVHRAAIAEGDLTEEQGKSADDFGVYIGDMIMLMREDIGTGHICVKDSANPKHDSSI